MTNEDLLGRIENLELAIARLESEARAADGLVAALVGILVTKTSTRLHLKLDDVPGLPPAWRDYIAQALHEGTISAHRG